MALLVGFSAENESCVGIILWLCHSVKVGEYFTKYNSSNWGFNHKSKFLLWLTTPLQMGYGLTSPYWHRQSVNGQTFRTMVAKTHVPAQMVEQRGIEGVEGWHLAEAGVS